MRHEAKLMANNTTFGNANNGFQAGVINGSVHAEFHVAQEPVETPPCPSIVIPFSRDQDFVDREATVDQGTILGQVIRKCRRPGSRTALVGLGGVGKSQLAIEYAYRIRDQSPETWVFWIHASSGARFEQSIRDIADCAKIYGRQNPKANILQLVHGWLHDKTKGPRRQARPRILDCDHFYRTSLTASMDRSLSRRGTEARHQSSLKKQTLSWSSR
jgi:hypothetical protein